MIFLAAFGYFLIGIILCIPYIYLKSKVLSKINLPYELPPIEIFIIAWPAYWVLLFLLLLYLYQNKLK